MVTKASKPTPQGVTSEGKYGLRVQLREDGSLPLPSEIVDALSLEPGTVMEITIRNGRVEARPIKDAGMKDDNVRPMPPRLPAQGILREYFHGWDDIQQFIAEERLSWEREWDTPQDDTSTGD